MQLTSEQVRNVAAVLILLLGLYVALFPNVAYAPVPRTVLYLLVSLLPAVLLASEASARFEMKLPGFLFTCGGTLAFVLGCLLLLTYLSKPEHQIAVFDIKDARGNRVIGLDEKGSVQVDLSGSLTVTTIVDESRIAMIFPEQVAETTLRIQLPGGPPYEGKVGYAGTRVSALVLGKDLSEVR